MASMMNPDCQAGKCDSCAGDGWDMETDQPAPCSCPCHDPLEESETPHAQQN